MRGFSLLEILVSIALSLIIMNATLSHYLVNLRHNASIVNKFADIAEVLLIVQYLQDAILASGFSPCTSMDNLISADKANSSLLGMSVLAQNHFKTTRMGDNFTQVKVLNTKTLAVLQQSFLPDQKLLLADCYHMEVVSLDAIWQESQGFKLKLKEKLKFSYTSHAYLGSLQQEEFFIKNGRLFYHADRVDVLSDKVQSFSVALSAAMAKLHFVVADKGYDFMVARRNV
jgi:prepilin-type N-terminal cleavage/methylation domain-containing protein